MKKTLSIITYIVFAAVLMISLHFAAVTVKADDIPHSGTCGDNLTWEIKDEVLTVSGSGPMYDYDSWSGQTSPWQDIRGEVKKIVIGDGVTTIGGWAFNNFWLTEEITIGKSVTSIGNYAFSSCQLLKNIIIPENVKTIGEHAFSYCEDVESLVIGNGVETIGACAFEFTPDVVSVNIPASVKEIGDSAFAQTATLEKITVDSNNAFYRDIDGVLYSKDGKTLIFFPCGYGNEYSVEKGTERIAGYAFSGSPVNKVAIPASLKEIEEYAFAETEELSEFSVDAGNAVFKDIDGVLFNKNGDTLIQYPNGKGEKYKAPEGVKKVADIAFFDTWIRQVWFQDGLEEIGNNAFASCWELENVKLPASVKKMGYSAFPFNDPHFNLYYESSEKSWKSIEGSEDPWNDYADFHFDHRHVIVSDPQTEATCTATGLSAGSHCSECGEIITEQTVIEAKGHDFSVSVEETDSEIETTYSCKLCDLSYTVTDVKDASEPDMIRNMSGGSIRHSYLTAESDKYMRVYFTDYRIGIEYYDRDFNLLSRKYISMELSLWGGFYAGDDAYYLAQGENNLEEDDTAEVIRIIKYDKNWNRLSAAVITGNQGLFGGEVRLPFNVGTVEMTEKDGNLFLVTGHQGYVDDQYGQGHQGFLMVRVDEKTMKGKIVSCDLWHSFAQYIKADDKNLFVLEQSEGSRFAKVSRYRPDTISSRSTPVLKYGGEHDSAWAIPCYATVDDLELSSDNVLTTGSSIDQSKWDNGGSEPYNIYITVTPKDKLSEADTQVKWMTSYKEISRLGEIYLTRINDNRFLLQWEEYAPSDVWTNNYLDDYKMHYLFIDGNGNVVNGEKVADGFLSDCHPVLDGDKVVYYGCDGQNLTFYVINTVTGEITSKKLSRKQEEEQPGSEDIPGENTDYTQGFWDVTSDTVNKTSYNAIYWAVDQGIVKGYNDGSFRPEVICTREQFSIMLWRFAGQPYSDADSANRFTDIGDFSNNTSKTAVAWAVENGIVKGFEDGSFQPKAFITRAQVAVMLWRFAGQPGVGSASSKFSDIGSYSANVQKAIIWLEGEKIASGYNDGTFRPDDGCQRQHMAIFLYRFAHNIIGESVG